MTKGEVESLRPHPRAPIYLDINQSTTTHYQTHSILTSQVKTYQHVPKKLLSPKNSCPQKTLGTKKTLGAKKTLLTGERTCKPTSLRQAPPG